MFGVDEYFLTQCLDKFEEEAQVDILIEECSELIKACCKVKRNDGFSIDDPYDSLKEELSHVLICAAMVAKIYDITEDDLEKEVNKKRTKYNFKKQENDLITNIECDHKWLHVANKESKDFDKPIECLFYCEKCKTYKTIF